MNKTFCLFSMTLAMAATMVDAAEKAGPRPNNLLNVTCSAVPNDGLDDTAALNEALMECRKAGRAQVHMAPGRYDFTSQASKPIQTCLEIDGIDELLIDGGGSEWVVRDWSLMLAVRNSGTVTLRNVSIDWAPLPFVCGEIVGTTDTYFDVAVFDEFPVRGGEKVKAIVEFDPVLKVPADDGADVQDVVERTELVAAQVLRVHTTRPVPVRTRRLVALCHMWYGPGALLFEKCQNVTLDRVTLYSAPGMGLRMQRCGNVSLNRFRAQVRPGSQRLMSTTADASHFSGCTGTIRIEDCLFEGNGDDAANIKAGLYLAITAFVDDRTVQARHRMGLPDPPQPGDRLEALDPETLLPRAVVKVRSVELEADGVHKITFEQPVSGVLRAGHLLGNLSTVPQVEIRRCTIRNSRARGFLLQSRNVLVEDCDFAHCTHGGMSVIVEVTDFCESITSRDVTIRGNRFEEVNVKPGSTFGVIGIIAFMKSYALPPEPGVHRNITIENNTIRGAAVAGIYAAGTQGLVVRGNTIEDVCRKPVRDGERQAIYLAVSSDILVENNRIDLDKQGAGCLDAMLVGPGCDGSSITVRDNVGFP